MTVDSEKMVEAALAHVPFDGWSPETFRAAMQDAGVAPAMARMLFPRGAVDLALAFHRMGDARMAAELAAQDLGAMRFRDRIAHAVRLRLELVADDKEAVRRGTTLFALPHHAPDGLRALWGTCDAIWDALGDTAQDYNYYTKRGTLSAVYGSTVLFWLGDESVDHAATWAFLDRRIDNVMQVEKAKGQARKSAFLSKVFAGPIWALGKIRAPDKTARSTMPGTWREPPSAP